MLIWRWTTHSGLRLTPHRPFHAGYTRLQSRFSSQIESLSPALLGRARALKVEHAQLTEKLNKNYDVQIAKQAGSLSSVVNALREWETAKGVRSLPSWRSQ